MIGKWGEAGVRTHAQADKYITDMQQATREVRTLLETAGLSRRPSMDDLERYERWKKACSPELLRYAAERARGTRMPIKYMDKLLAEWEKAGVDTPEAAKALRPAGESAASNAYQQHSYTEADFDDSFYYNPANDYHEGGNSK